MKTPQAIFESLKKENGTYGKYVLFFAPQIDNAGTNGECAYYATATTLEQIAEMQADGWCDDDGYPTLSECYKAKWEIYPDYDGDGCSDESDACDWNEFDVYLYNDFVESVSL